MQTLPASILSVILPFRILFRSRATWAHALLLLVGALLCRGGRTVCGILRTLGMSGEQAFDKYHKFLNRARWDLGKGSDILLRQTANTPTVYVAIDEHIERRRGQKIKDKGTYRDAVRSTKKQVVKVSGLKWITVMVLKTCSWSKRVLALPVQTILAASERSNIAAGRRHKTTIDWARQVIKYLRRTLKEKRIVLVGDGGFANASLAWTALKHRVHLVTRLRTDARLFDFPPKQQGPGRRAAKGKRLMTPKQMLAEEGLDWQCAKVAWYGGELKEVLYISFTALWHVNGYDPIPARIVLLKDPEGKYQPVVLMGVADDFSLSAEEIIESFVKRWNQEVTHKEVRENLGVETQRQWADKSIARTTPLLFGLYTIVALIAEELHRLAPLQPMRSAAWYQKSHVTFSDALCAVKQELWQFRLFNVFDPENRTDLNPPQEDLDYLINLLSDTG